MPHEHVHVLHGVSPAALLFSQPGLLWTASRNTAWLKRGAGWGGLGTIEQYCVPLKVGLAGLRTLEDY